MTVRDLIEILEEIEDDDMDVLIEVEGINTEDFDVYEKCKKYYGKIENNGWVAKERKCVVLS